MTAQVTIVTPTYNKPTYFAQCAESVLAQTFQDWVWWVVINAWEWPTGYLSLIHSDPRILPIWFAVRDGVRKRNHVTAWIVDYIYRKVQTPYIYFLADDDLIDKDGLQHLVPKLDEYAGLAGVCYEPFSQGQAVYGRCEVQNEQPDGTFITGCWCFDGVDVGLGTGIDPDCRLDSSQILHTKALWDKATENGWRLSDKLEDAAHADGLLLNRLAEFATFHYVPQRINIHRRTRLSEWHKPQL